MEPEGENNRIININSKLDRTQQAAGSDIRQAMSNQEQNILSPQEQAGLDQALAQIAQDVLKYQTSHPEFAKALNENVESVKDALKSSDRSQFSISLNGLALAAQQIASVAAPFLVGLAAKIAGIPLPH